jgi:glycoside/pentoside/hexuronide:cation symporter, GPH family
VMRNRAVLLLLGTDLSLSTAVGVIGTLFFFFFQQLKGFTKGQAELLLLAYFVSAVGGGAIWMMLADRIGKHRSLAVAGGAFVVTLALALAVPAHHFWITLAAMLAAGLPYSASSVLVRAMLGDIRDEERLRTGEDRTGLLFAISAGNVKIANAIAVGATFPILQLLGFNPTAGVANSARALAGLAALFGVGPGLLGLLASALILRYPLTAGRHAEIRRRLDEIDAARAAGELYGPSAAE